MRKILLLAVLYFVFLQLLFFQGCGKKSGETNTDETNTKENKQSSQNSQNSSKKSGFGWKDGISVSDIPDFPLKGSLDGKEVNFQYINFEKWHGSNDNVINFSLVKPPQACGYIDGFIGFQVMNKGNSFNQGDWVKSKFDEDAKTFQAFFKNGAAVKSTASWNCALSIESISDKTVKGKIALFFNDAKKSWVAGKFEAAICNN